MNPGIFRRYDIRGIVDRELTPEVAEAIGTAFGTLLAPQTVMAAAGPVAVGRDVRESSPSLTRALIKGLVATGLDVVDLGVVPTPGVYFYLCQERVAGGVVVTGSHNPANCNGFKLCRGTHTLYEQEIQEIHRIIERGAFTRSARHGRYHRTDVLPRYLDYLVAQFRPARQRRAVAPLKIVVDAGNGTAGIVAPRLLRSLGHVVEELYCQPDGRFPHHHPDPTVPANLTDLQLAVQATGADLGVAYDGDGDRLGVVDHRGEIVWGDRLLTLYARQVLQEHPGTSCIGDVKCSQLFFDDVRNRGGVPVMWRTGHSLIKAKMRETGALLAGEMSGHFFFADRYYGFDDALYATARLLEILEGAREDDPHATLARLVSGLPQWVATPEIRLCCPDDIKHEIVRCLAEEIVRLRARCALPAGLQTEIEEVITLDGLRLVGRNGWGVVRASNTEPALILRFEAASSEKMQQIRAFVEGALFTIRNDLLAAFGRESAHVLAPRDVNRDGLG